ncbi:MAG: MobF family relaxase, partial [Nakamurella sp.]
HRDSRAGDPDLHTHVAISNKVQTLDGRWLALDGRMIHRYLVAASEYYNTRLEAEVIARVGGQFLARETEPGKRPIRELAGVNTMLNETFSSRRRDITTQRAELIEQFRGRHHRLPTTVEMIALSQQANLATRQAKHEPRSLAEQRQQWRQQAMQVLGSLDALRDMVAVTTAQQTPPAVALTSPEVSELAVQTIQAIEGSRAQWSRHNVLAEALRQLRYAGHAIGPHTNRDAELVAGVALGPEHSIPIGTDPEPVGVDIPAALQRADGSSVYRVAGGQLHTSPAILAAEQSIVAAAGTGGGMTISPGDVELAILEWSANNNGRTLNTSQTTLVHEVTASGRRLQLALAPAGTGKTTTMGALATVWRSTGGNVIALSPQTSAARGLADEIPGVTSDTVDMLITELGDGPSSDPQRWLTQVDQRTLIIVAEAGIGATAKLAAVVAFAGRQGARVLFVGDDRQRAAAGAGGALRDIEATHGSLSLDEVLRFRDPRQADASLAIRAGDPGAVGYYIDNIRIHSVTPDQAADQVFAAWHADRQAGREAIMIAPTLDLVSELNARARTARLSTQGQPVGRERELPNGETLSTGDLIVTKKNNRRLSLGGTDFVCNNYRWIVTAVNQDGSITATEIRVGRTRTLPASYLNKGHVRLGYAATTASVQGLTVAGNAHSILTAGMTRNEAYPALTRATGDNHGYLVVGGVGDPHDVITPEAISPETSAELFAAIIGRDGSDRSALTEMRESADPANRLGPACDAYTHAIITGLETLLGAERVAQITADAEQALPGITSAPAWETLRGHLVALAGQGGDPIAALTAASERELRTANDPSAVLDWRLDRTGNHSLREGPLPWLPAVPATLTEHPEWEPYLTARQQQVTDLADHITETAAGWTVPTAPAWATPYLSNANLTRELAVWRASHRVEPADLRPAGPRPMRIAHAKMHGRLTGAAAGVAGDPADGTGRWSKVLTAAGAQLVTTDPYWPVLAARLTGADTAGLPVERLIRAAIGERPLPSEAPAAALLSRLTPHIGAPTAAVTSHALRPAWTDQLTSAVGEQLAARITVDRLWPVIVTRIDAAARSGHDPAQLITAAAGMLAAAAGTTAEHQQPVILLTNIVALTDPDPIIDTETLPPDPADADLHPPVDAHTTASDSAESPTPTADGPTPTRPPPEKAPHRNEPGEHLPLPEEPADPEHITPEEDDDGPGDEQNTLYAADNTRLHSAQAAAYDYYRQQMPDSWAANYLAGRGLGALTGRAGLAPPTWTATVDHLRGAGYTDAELLAAGLARTSSRGTLIDAFRDRVMLPIHDADGQVAGFTGRRNPATVDEYNPKYLNSPTTAIYSKTELPYGLHPRALDALRGGADVAIVEGPMDAEAINLAAGGRVVAIASLGTALTDQQLDTLNQVAPLADRRVLTVMDTDDAGRAAAVRAHRLLADAGVPDPQAVTLPDGRNDPAETLAVDGPDRLAAALHQDTHPLADLAVEDVLDRWPAPTTPEYRIGALDEVAPLVAALPAECREEQVSRIAQRLTLDEHTVTSAVMEHLAPAAGQHSPLGLPTPPVLGALEGEPSPAVDELDMALAELGGPTFGGELEDALQAIRDADRQEADERTLDGGRDDDESGGPRITF